MRQVFTFIFFILVAFSATAQTESKISGVVKDEQGKAIQSATISLLKASDSSLVKVAVSNKDGKYEFNEIKAGQYFVSASSVGYAKAISKSVDTKGNAEISTITLIQNSKDLGAVTVSAQRPFVETKLDKTVVNVDASPTSAGSTALDILEKSPGIMVDNDGNISLKGKQGVIVMMDGKQTYLSASDLANLLKNMPASVLL